MKLLGSTKNKITKDKNGENEPHLEITEVVLVFLKTFNSEYDEIIVWFTDQNSKPLGIEDRINLTMVIKDYVFKNMILSYKN